MHIFLSGSGWRGKSHLMKVIYNNKKILLYHCKDPEKPRVFLLRPVEISAAKVGATTIHCGLGIKPQQI